ncbi:hypothetical protein GCM10025876_12440 [Demequina litorisediminis]|uniref:Uncharacterized protein n=1 Tax=Demequina litorisediminis TaxID=1849022 RepID=A0ABQ6ICE6_9MICO|nr:hypothetical protein GCM10025876_12440 [Demequina litorisediminis]
MGAAHVTDEVRGEEVHHHVGEPLDRVLQDGQFLPAFLLVHATADAEGERQAQRQHHRDGIAREEPHHGPHADAAQLCDGPERCDGGEHRDDDQRRHGGEQQIDVDAPHRLYVVGVTAAEQADGDAGREGDQRDDREVNALATHEGKTGDDRHHGGEHGKSGPVHWRPPSR